MSKPTKEEINQAVTKRYWITKQSGEWRVGKTVDTQAGGVVGSFFTGYYKTKAEATAAMVDAWKKGA